MDAFDKQLRLLRRLLKTLPATVDRPIARRNARQRVLKALRSIRVQLDSTHPAIVKRKKVKRLTLQGRTNRLLRNGWAVVESPGDFARFAVAGVPHRHNGYDRYVPAWAIAIGSDKPTQLRAARRSRSMQKAAIVTAALLD